MTNQKKEVEKMVWRFEAFIVAVMLILIVCMLLDTTLSKSKSKQVNPSSGSSTSAVEEYRRNYKRGLSDEEIEVLNDKGLELYSNEVIIDGLTYYYPVVLDASVYCMAENSYLYRYDLSNGTTVELVDCSLHHEVGDHEVLMEENLDGMLTYNTAEYKVVKWCMSNQIKEFEVPAGAVYAGYSELEGYIFRCRSDVYSFKNQEVKKISTGVKLVIVADYGYSPNKYSQPLFLMNNGEVRVYCKGKLKHLKEDGERIP